MSPAQPLALLLATLAVPVAAAYLHRRKRRVQSVPSLVLLRVIAGQNTPTRSALATPRHLVSLVLVVLGLLALTVGLADLRPEAGRPRDYVVVLDTSASMAAADATGQTRHEQATRSLVDAMSRWGPDDRVALITTGGETIVRMGLTQDRARLLELAAHQDLGGDSAGAIGALRIADAMLRRTDTGTIVFISDGVGVGTPHAEHPLERIAVGRPGPNLGINALAVREADALGSAEVFLAVTSDVGTAREVEVALQVDDRVVDVLSIDIPAEARVEHLHRTRLPEGQWVTATLQRHGEDVLAADDTARTPRNAGHRVRVLLVAKTRLSFTAEALRLHPRVDLTVIGPHDRPPSSTHDLLVLETSYAAGSLPSAPHVVTFGIPAADVGLTEGESVSAPEILRWSFDDPLFRFVDLGGLELPRATTMRIDDGMTPLIDTESGTIAARSTWDGHDLVHFGFSPTESDLVLRVGFVNLVANIVEWAAPQSGLPPGTAVLPESETRIDPVAERLASGHENAASLPPRDGPWWPWLVGLALGLLAIETALAPGLRALHRVRSTVRRRGPA